MLQNFIPELRLSFFNLENKFNIRAISIINIIIQIIAETTQLITMIPIFSINLFSKFANFRPFYADNLGNQIRQSWRWTWRARH